MTAPELIKAILASKSPTEIFTDLENYTTQYKQFISLIHPDRCMEVGAQEASMILTKYKDELSKGKSHTDDAGGVLYAVTGCKITSDNKAALELSLSNYKKLMALKERKDIDLQRYMPSAMSIADVDSDSVLSMQLNKRCLPLSAVGTLPQEHVNWILSRILEYGAYLYQRGIVHCGFTPESIYIEPANHGIRIVSYYHMKTIGDRLTTVSGRFMNFYPDKVIKNKVADPLIDVELAKSIAIWLLGDKSGIGNSLRKTHSLPFLDFISHPHETAEEAFIDYRKMLKSNFESKFYTLTV